VKQQQRRSRPLSHCPRRPPRARADRHHVARRAIELENLPCFRRRHFDRRLVRHDIREKLILLHIVAESDMPGDKFGFRRAFAHVRKFENVAAHDLAPAGVVCVL
jgi:hypothetical protein